MPRASVWIRLDDHLEDLMPRELHVELTGGSVYCWGCKLTLVTHSRDGETDLGVTFYRGGGGSPQQVLAECLDTLDVWLENETHINEVLATAAFEAAPVAGKQPS